MRIGRLTLKIYLYSVAVVLAAVGVLIATVFSFKADHTQHLMLASGHILKSVWPYHEDPESLQTAAEQATQPSRAVVSFYDAAGRLISSTATPPLPMPSPSQLVELREKGFVGLGHATMAHELRQAGGAVAVGVVRFPLPSPWRLLWPLLLLLAALLLLAVIFARHLVVPLQRVANAAKRFGRGDLRARAGSRRKDEIGEVGRTFDAMADRVAGLMAGQQELMANVSHELRTPLSRIQVAVDLVTDGKSDRVKQLMPDIARDLAEVDRLIDDIMTVAKLGLAGTEGSASVVVPLRLEVLSSRSLIEDAVSRFRSHHPTRELTVELDPELPELCADAVLLRRVVDNLLENARKFSDSETTIRLSAHASGAGVAIASPTRASASTSWT